MKQTNIYKLKYNTRGEAIKNLIDNNVIDSGLKNKPKTHSVVWLPRQIENKGEYDKDGEVIIEPTFSNDVLVDVMTEDIIDFGEYQTYPNNNLHNWE